MKHELNMSRLAAPENAVADMDRQRQLQLCIKRHLDAVELCIKRHLDAARDRADTASRLTKVARAEKVSAAPELLALQGAQEQLKQDHEDVVKQLAVMKRTISSSSVKERQFERLVARERLEAAAKVLRLGSQAARASQEAGIASARSSRCAA